jgi:hypothetical protein
MLPDRRETPAWAGMTGSEQDKRGLIRAGRLASARMDR